ncbi:M28 family peptidase [Aquicella lusitana]|nr:M28 family peptidase [Aquicella lusitana]
MLNSYAGTSEQFLVVPRCLLSGNSFRYEELASLKWLRLIKITDLHPLQAAVVKKEARCRGFINVTRAWRDYSKRKQLDAAAFLSHYAPASRRGDLTRHYKIQYQNEVNSLVREIDTAQIRRELSKLTHFPDRHLHSEDGARAAQWIRQQAKTLIASSERKDTELLLIPTEGHSKQPSVMMKIGKALSEPGIVIGAHLDTIDSVDESQPGADDGASGVATVLETARLLLNSHLQFNKPIYLVWYAGSEAGKLGSQSVVQYFKRHHLPVDSVLQLDMTGYVGADGEPQIGLADDSTDAGLTTFVADLVTAYVKLPVGVRRCGYACSDHVIWYQNGNRVAYPLETMDETSNPYVHKRRDTMDKLSLTHVRDFVKLSTAFAVELAEPIITPLLSTSSLKR